MKQLKLMIMPQPGAKPEYVDDVVLVNPSSAELKVWEQQLPGTDLVLEGYTRDAWAWKPTGGTEWVAVTVASATGRQKLVGFCNYLKERQKSAYGRFAPAGVFCISYTQPAAKGADTFQMQCRIAVDLTKVPKCNLQPMKAKSAASASQQPPVSKPAASTTTTARKPGGGLLGKLVGAQQRTNQHVAHATATTSSAKAAMHSTSDSGDDAVVNGGGGGAGGGGGPRTASQVLADFRQAMQDKMLDFDLNENEEELRIKLNLSEHTAGLSTEDKTRVTMEILKYMVYEAAEEVNEEWIAHKEPSEFMDETTIVVYKEGAAPPEVLEEINKGELPDEVRGQQRAIQEERHRMASKAESRNKQQIEADVHRQQWEGDFDDEEDVGLAVLNKNKRDRRTIEDYEREKRENAKRGRM